MWLSSIVSSTLFVMAMSATNEYLPPNKGYNYDPPSIPFPTNNNGNKVSLSAITDGDRKRHGIATIWIAPRIRWRSALLGYTTLSITMSAWRRSFASGRSGHGLERVYMAGRHLWNPEL